MKKKKAKQQLKLGDKMWFQKKDVLFEAVLAFENHGDFWASPTTSDTGEGHYTGCVAVKVDSKGKETHL